MYFTHQCHGTKIHDYKISSGKTNCLSKASIGERVTAFGRVTDTIIHKTLYTVRHTGVTFLVHSFRCTVCIRSASCCTCAGGNVTLWLACHIFTVILHNTLDTGFSVIDVTYLVHIFRTTVCISSAGCWFSRGCGS